MIGLKLSDLFTPNFHRASRRCAYQLYLPPGKTVQDLTAVHTESYLYGINLCQMKLI